MHSDTSHSRRRGGSATAAAAGSAGFTLIEVLVALMIVAVSLPALLMSIGTMSSNTLYARETAIAHWVAQNRLQELYITRELQNELPTGRIADFAQMAGETWDYVIEVEPTELPPVMRVRIGVTRQGGENKLVDLSGFMLGQF